VVVGKRWVVASGLFVVIDVVVDVFVVIKIDVLV
jgi:hypothetical protein